VKVSRETINQVRAAVDIVEVIGARLSLSPSGGDRYKALSPFTNEKTPSFIVSRDRQMFHCFSSGRGGDVFGFLMEFEGLSFSEALRKLADQAGIPLAPASEQDDREEYLRAQLLELGRFAADFYKRLLADPLPGAPGRDYLSKRALKPETMAKFGLGFAPDQWDALVSAALKRQFKNYVLEASGLFRRGESGGRGLYDFFRNRVIFPIRDISGNVVAFGGRDLGQSPAKYINSPETAVYKKSRVLYGLHEAREGIRAEKFAVLVEGYFDLLRCFDAGITNVVATCGTALTEQQAALIRRYAPKVVLVYDGDAAGVKAALRGSGVLTAAGLEVRALALPDNKDPDDFIRDEGADRFREMLAGAPDFVAFYARMNRDRTTTVEGRTEVARELFEMIRHVTDRMKVDGYLDTIERALGLQPWSTRREFERMAAERERGPAAAPGGRTAAAPAEHTPPHRDDLEFVAAVLAYPALLRRAAEACAGLNLPESPFTEVLRALFAAGGAGPAVADSLASDEAKTLWSGAMVDEPPAPDRAEEVVSQRVTALARDAIRREAEGLLAEIARADRDKDWATLRRLQQRKIELDRRRDGLPAA